MGGRRLRRLAALLGPPEAPAGVEVDRAGPADYRRFLAKYGPGRLGEINIPAPGLALRDDIHETLRLRHFPCAVDPEPGGLTTWAP